MKSRLMSFGMMNAGWLRTILLALCLLSALPARAECTTTGACITAGPRLASVDTGKSALLGPLLGGLLGTGVALNRPGRDGGDGGRHLPGLRRLHADQGR